MVSSILVYLPLILFLSVGALVCVFKKLRYPFDVLKVMGVALSISVVSILILQHEAGQALTALKETCATAPKASELKGYVSTCVDPQNLTASQRLIHRDARHQVYSSSIAMLKQVYVYDLAYGSAEAEYNTKLLKEHGVYPSDQEAQRLTVAYTALEDNHVWLTNAYGELLKNDTADKLYTSYISKDVLTEEQLQYAKVLAQRVNRIKEELPVVHTELKSACRHVEATCLEAFTKMVKINRYVNLYQDPKFQAYIQQQLSHRIAQFEYVGYNPNAQ